MTSSLEAAGIRSLLLDIEGTTTPVEFVYDVLFPHARAHVRGFLERQFDDTKVRAELARLREEHAGDASDGLGPPSWRDHTRSEAVESAATYLQWLMDRDRKSTALKALQGRIWQEGFERGELLGQVFSDVPRAFERWRSQGREIAIFSSGSVLAQKLLFRHSDKGDLSGFIRDYFDTTTGPKREATSYTTIAAGLGRDPGAILFLSDIEDELRAAKSAGLRTALCVRGRSNPPAAAHSVIRSFDEVCP